MNIKHSVATLIFLSFLHTIVHGNSEPVITQGVSVEGLYNHDVQPQLPNIANLNFRSRIITVKPGGTIAPHEHSTRPGIVYVIEGSMTEYRQGKPRILKPGDHFLEDKDTQHWFQNTTDKDCKVIAFDLIAGDK